jgi:hypothetical protein
MNAVRLARVKQSRRKRRSIRELLKLLGANVFGGTLSDDLRLT